MPPAKEAMKTGPFDLLLKKHEAGAYFVTICAKDRECLFGDMKQGQMMLNDAGHMVKTWWMEIPDPSLPKRGIIPPFSKGRLGGIL